VTVTGKLIVKDEVTLAQLINLMRQFRDAIEYAHKLLFEEKISEAEVKRKLTGILSNA